MLGNIHTGRLSRSIVLARLLLVFIMFNHWLVSCQRADGYENDHVVLSGLARTRTQQQTNFGSIMQWSGSANVKSSFFNESNSVRGSNECNIIFKMDVANENFLIYSVDVVHNGEIPGTWGELVTKNLRRQLQYARSNSRTVLVENATLKLSTLTPLAFNPLSAFRWAFGTPDEIFASTKRMNNSEWGEVQIEEKGDELVLSWKNKTIDCGPTVFTFSSAYGGNLISCTNQSPFKTYETKIEWCSSNDIWLPRNYLFETLGNNGHREYQISATFKNEFINQDFANDDFSMTQFRLPDKTVIIDKRTGKNSMLMLQPANGINRRGVLGSAVLALFLVGCFCYVKQRCVVAKDSEPLL